MIAAYRFVSFRHIGNFANHAIRINVRSVSQYCKINDNISGLTNEQKEVSNRLTDHCTLLLRFLSTIYNDSCNICLSIGFNKSNVNT